MSSSRDELAGITALTIMAKLFHEYHSAPLSVQAIWDNQGVKKKCNKLCIDRLCRHSGGKYGSVYHPKILGFHFSHVILIG